MFLGVVPLVSAAAGLFALPPAPAAAAGAFSIVTAYPVVETQPGTTVKLDLTVDAPSPETVQLAVDGLPDGWSSTLRGGGFVIGAVTAGLDDPSKVTLEVRVPPEAAAGPQELTVTGTDPSGATVRQQVSVVVDAAVDTGIGVTADFPSLRGDPKSTFTYTLTVTNNTPSSQTFTFTPTAPQGWTATASPTAQSKANTVTVDPDGTTNVQVSATPPDSTAEGTYDIQVDVTSATGLSGKIGLVAEVTGTPQLQVATADERLDVKGEADKEQQVQIVVANGGTAALQDVKFAASPPSGWTVTFEPTSLAEVKPNETAQVIATIKPTKDAVVGDYAIAVRASAGSDSSNLELRYTVTRSRWLGVVAIALVLVALGGLYGVFRRFGRR
ncbi:MAG: NEW3 domain-containing protein [Acidimicrobiales bacterium]